jgi:organic hydroperoxide reductase OsmC/OhrA
MSEYHAELAWTRDGAVFTDNRYSRRHQWTFDGGANLVASSSPYVVPLPLSDPTAIDPEEAFVASVASCHMLWFLSLAATRGFIVDSYRDKPSGLLAKDASGRLAVTRVTLRPAAEFSGTRMPSKVDVCNLHGEAHAKCFIANSIRSEVRCEPPLGEAP